MKRLVCAKVLTEVRSDNGGILGWSITQSARSTLVPIGNNDDIYAKRGPIYRTSYTHDVALRQIRDALEVSSAIVKWIPEHILKADMMKRSPYLQPHDRNEKMLTVPDALLHLRSGGKDSKAALELELTQKSKKRLYKKIENYTTTDSFNFAFFVAASERLMSLLQEVHRNVVATSWRVKIRSEQNGIYFTTLKNIRIHGIHAQFVAAHETLSFAQLTD